MTDQEINIAIAEACGWYDVKVRPGHWVRIYKPRGRKNGYTFKYPRAIPDYCHDLNAMHDAEKTLSRGRGTFRRSGFSTYITLLRRCDAEMPECATARQRAEAFLRTKGLWKP